LFYKTKIRERLIVVFLVVGLAPLLLFGAYLTWYTFTVQERQIVIQHKALAKLAAENIGAFFHEQLQVINTHIKGIHQADKEIPDLDFELRKFIAISADSKHKHVLNSAHLVDGSGNTVGYAARSGLISNNRLESHLSEKAFTVPYNTRQKYYSPVYFDDETGEPLVRLGLPVIDLISGNIKYVFVTEMRLKAIWNALSELNYGRSGVAYVTDSSGLVVAHPNPSVVFRGTHIQLPDESGVMIGVSGEKSFVAASKIGYEGRALYAVLEQPVAEAYEYYYHMLAAIVGFVIVSLLSAMIVGGRVIKDVIDPVESLSDTAKAISNGELTSRTGVDREDEIGGLAYAFDSMTGRLVSAIKDVEYERLFLRTIIDSFAYPLYVIDANSYKIELSNAAATSDACGEKLLSAVTTQSNQHAGNITHPDLIDEIKISRKPISFEYVEKTDSGLDLIYEIHGHPIMGDDDVSQVILYGMDITEKRQLEGQLLQTQKMEALGRLAGGVAHDFNNLLTAIIGYAELMLAKMPDDAPNRRWVEVIRDSGEIGSSLTSQLLTFSRKQLFSMKPMAPAIILSRIEHILRRLLGSKVELRISLDKPLWNINADASQMDQVFINLAINARDAMPMGGVLDLIMENIVVEDAPRQQDKIVPGRYVRFVFKDSGVGMTDETESKIFEPFFTTKGDKGTGLGLATVYGIVQQQGGYINVRSVLGEGTSMGVYLPATDDVVVMDQEDHGQQEYYGSEGIMVVDDDPYVLGFINETLRSYGYQVYVADNGREALAVIERIEGGVDLLLTDVVMKGVDGFRLSEEIGHISPKTKVLFMSGYPYDVLDREGVLEGAVDLISKPVRINKLLAEIKRLLGGETH